MSENTEWAKKKHNPEKLGQDECKQNKQHNTIFIGHHYKILNIIDSPNTHIHDRLLSCLDKSTSIKSGGVKLVLCAQTSSLAFY
jgi:hypothetical protein